MGEVKKRGQAAVDQIYPPLDGYGTKTNRRDGETHIGYTHSSMRKCVCGAFPVLEQYAMDLAEGSEHRRNVPARVFVAICPKCERIIRQEGSLEECIAMWNGQELTEASEMDFGHGPRNYSDDACRKISDKVVLGMKQEAISMILLAHDLQRRARNALASQFQRETFRIELNRIHARLRLMNDEFYGPVLLDKDPEAVLSDIRKAVNPDLTPDERVQIPLRLDRM